MGPWAKDSIAGGGEAQFDVRGVGDQLDRRLQDSKRATVHAREHCMPFYLTDNVLHTQTPVVENGVGSDLVPREDAIWGLLHLDHDVGVGFECPIAHAPFPPLQRRWIFVQDRRIVHRADMQA